MTAPIEVERVSRTFGDLVALSDVSLTVQAGEIHALLGPNGAGKTTLLRIMAGLTAPSRGRARVLGRDTAAWRRETRQAVGVVPSGDRSFYLRLSGHENLVFFGRLYGLDRRTAARRSREVLDQVGLAAAANRPAGQYSHGMLKRLAVARALMIEPPVLLVDEATHDLDPEGARRVQGLVREAAARGAAVIWTTQRVDEIRGFAERVTVLHRGQRRFSGTVAQLMSRSAARRYVLRVRNGGVRGAALQTRLDGLMAGMGGVTEDRTGDGEHLMLSLAEGVALGDAIAQLTAAGFTVLTCQEERPELEEAFLRLTTEDEA